MISRGLKYSQTPKQAQGQQRLLVKSFLGAARLPSLSLWQKMSSLKSEKERRGHEL